MMSVEKFNPRTLILIVFIIAAGAIRTYLSSDENMFGLSNFSPIGAMALFGGIYFKKTWKAFFFPLFTLFISDVILNLTVFSKGQSGILYGGWYYVYAAFVMMVAVGRLVKKVSVASIIASGVAVVLIHWLFTDFGVWLNSKAYAQTFTGYIQCLIAAIPFEWRFLTGTMIFSGILFGVFELMKKRYTALA